MNEPNPNKDKISLTLQTILATPVIEAANAELELNGSLVPVTLTLHKEVITNPPEDVRIKALLQKINQDIFDFVQVIQKQNIEERKQSYE